MSVWNRLLGRKKAPLPGPWQKVAPVDLSQTTPDTRRYLENSAYQLPKDEEEDFRLDFQHHALFHALGNHYVAPLSLPLHAIVDVGAGTGIWACEIARQFPNALVVGIDLSASSFKSPVPENCLLRTGNVLTGMPFPDAFFSFTHQRLLVAGITAANWPHVIQELVRVTRPNGWVELVEIDNRMQKAGPATTKLLAFLEGVSKSQGFDGEVIRHLGDLLIQEGLQGVEMQPIPIPVGDWAGRVGNMMKRDLLSVLNAIKVRSCTLGRLSTTEFDQMVQAMTAEWETHQTSCLFYAAYGKRVQT